MALGTIALLLAFTPAVAARPAAVGNAQGTIAVGEWFEESCDEDTYRNGVIPSTDGRGLYAPGFRPDTRGPHSAYSLITGTNIIDEGSLSNSPPHPDQAALALCGRLTTSPVSTRAGQDSDPDLRPWTGEGCFDSKGYAGHGAIGHPSDGPWPDLAAVEYALEQIGWKASAGKSVPMLGLYERLDGSKVVERGQFVALAQMQGGISCFEPSGARLFVVVLTYALVPLDEDPVSDIGPVDWNQVTDPADPKDDGPQGPTNPWGDKKSS